MNANGGLHGPGPPSPCQPGPPTPQAAHLPLMLVLPACTDQAHVEVVARPFALQAAHLPVESEIYLDNFVCMPFSMSV